MIALGVAPAYRAGAPEVSVVASLPACVLAGRDGVEARRWWEWVARGLARVADVVGVAAPLLVGAGGCTDGGKDEPRDTAENVDSDADGYVARDDCDDENPDVHPGITDPCNGVDDDCSGVVDDGVPGETTLCAENEALWFVQEQHYSHEDGCGASISGDIDGDGRADLLLGGSGWDSLGQVHVFRAADLDVGVVPTELDHWLLTGDVGDHASGCQWGSGRGATFVPDLDGDERSEILVGAFGTNDSQGSAYLLTAAALDGAVGELRLSDFANVRLSDSQGSTSYAGVSVSSVGDLDGDAVPDLFVGAEDHGWIVAGRTVLDSQEADLSQGLSLVPPDLRDDFVFANVGQEVGDVDGDGLDDLLMPCPGCGSLGTAYLYLGSNLPATGELGVDAADLQVTGDRLNRFGFDAAGGADIDGDGLDDWAVASIDAGEGGGVYIFLNSASLLGGSYPNSQASARIVEESGAHGHFGAFLTLGDDDLDGRADLGVEDNYPGERHFIFLAPTLATGVTAFPADAASHFVTSDDGFTGGRLDMADFDGDGADDLLVAALYWGPYDYPDGYGAALLFLGT